MDGGEVLSIEGIIIGAHFLSRNALHVCYRCKAQSGQVNPLLFVIALVLFVILFFGCMIGSFIRVISIAHENKRY